MVSHQQIKDLFQDVRNLIESDKSGSENDELWGDAGARALILIDKAVTNSISLNSTLPKSYSKDNVCILEALFIIVSKYPKAIYPFENDIWNNRPSTSSQTATTCDAEKAATFYKLALTRACLLVSQLLGDKFVYAQKLLIKYIFSPSDVCSLFAADMYSFILRIVQPQTKSSMCQILMNLCRKAPTERGVVARVLVDRAKHPVVNFDNPRYHYLMNCF